MQTWVTLSGGTKWAFRLDGLISRTCMFVSQCYVFDTNLTHSATTHGNMIAIQNANDFEFYSANSAGGIQGYGYQCRNDGYLSMLFSLFQRKMTWPTVHVSSASYPPLTGLCMT